MNNVTIDIKLTTRWENDFEITIYPKSKYSVGVSIKYYDNEWIQATEKIKQYILKDFNKTELYEEMRKYVLDEYKKFSE